MAHILLGDAKTQTALRKYVADHVLKSTTTDEELTIFEPDVTKDHLMVWRQEGFKTKELERTLGNHQDGSRGKTQTTLQLPFATASYSSTIALRAPSAVAVAWLNKNKANFTTSIGDRKPMYVNPSMMACYGIQMDFNSWTLVGEDMRKNRVDAINRWYLLGEAARQFKDAQWPNFIGYMWMWEALRPTDLDLWDEHVHFFIQTERKAYQMITSRGDDDAYMARIDDIIGDNLRNAKNAGYKGRKVSIHLSKLACEMSLQACMHMVEAGYLLDLDLRQALACKLASMTDNRSEFNANNVSTNATSGEAPLTLRLAYAGCFPRGVADDKVDE
ncbi:hypothetical protein MRX96_010879 [Rhipicephalus microplus]